MLRFLTMFVSSGGPTRTISKTISGTSCHSLRPLHIPKGWAPTIDLKWSLGMLIGMRMLHYWSDIECSVTIHQHMIRNEETCFVFITESNVATGKQQRPYVHMHCAHIHPFDSASPNQPLTLLSKKLNLGHPILPILWLKKNHPALACPKASSCALAMAFICSSVKSSGFGAARDHSPTSPSLSLPFGWRSVMTSFLSCCTNRRRDEKLALEAELKSGTAPMPPRPGVVL